MFTNLIVLRFLFTQGDFFFIRHCRQFLFFFFILFWDFIIPVSSGSQSEHKNFDCCWQHEVGVAVGAHCINAELQYATPNL